MSYNVFAIARRWPAASLRRAISLTVDSLYRSPACIANYRRDDPAQELERARDELDNRLRPRSDKTRVLAGVGLDGAHLSGVTIASSSNAFQWASFKGCNLKDATLQGGVSAFQFARFDNSNLANAILVGGAASFQEATFVGADLTGAVLTGGGASFQGSSFE